MNDFFQNVMGEHLLNSAPAMFDWLFDDGKFDGPIWSTGTKRKFSNRVMKLEGFGKTTFKRKTARESYPETRAKRNRPKKPYAIFSSGGSLGQDFVRHIRNGIAHGNARLFKSGTVDYIEIYDYGSKEQQTAYIVMPLVNLSRIYSIYLDVSKSVTNRKKGQSK